MKRPLPVPLGWAKNAPWHLFGDRMWSSSTHIIVQGHRGRIGSTGIASLSTALAPPSLTCYPLPHAGFAIAPCKTTESFSLLSHTPRPPRQPNTSVLRTRRDTDAVLRGVLSEYAPSAIFLGARRVRSTSTAAPTTPLAVMMRVCVRTYVHTSSHSFSGVRGVTYLGTYLTSNRPPL